MAFCFPSVAQLKCSGWQSKVVHAASGLPSTNVIYTVAIHAYSDNYIDHPLNVFSFREHKSTLTCLRFFFCLYFTLWFNSPLAWPDDCLFVTLKIYSKDCKQGVCCNNNLFDNTVTETTSQCTLFKRKNSYFTGRAWTSFCCLKAKTGHSVKMLIWRSRTARIFTRSHMLSNWP